MHACFFNNLNEILLTVEIKFSRSFQIQELNALQILGQYSNITAARDLHNSAREILHHNPEQKNNNQNTAMQSPLITPQRFCSKQLVETMDRKLKLTQRQELRSVSRRLISGGEKTFAFIRTSAMRDKRCKTENLRLTETTNMLED